MIQDLLNRYVLFIGALQKRQIIRNLICQVKAPLIIEFHNSKQGSRRFRKGGQVIDIR